MMRLFRKGTILMSWRSLPTRVAGGWNSGRLLEVEFSCDLFKQGVLLKQFRLSLHV